MKDKVDITGEKSGKEEITSIKNMVRNLSFRLSGYIYSTENNELIPSGKPLATTNIINVAVSLLQPFADNSNLITSKEKLVFFRQKWEINTAFNRFVAKNIGDNTDNYEVIIKSFKTTLQNIGDIILNSKDIMKPYLVGLPEETGQSSEW